MAKLINGNGNPAVYAAEDSDWFAAIMGNITAITAIGEQFRADQADANTIEVFDGVIITQEGRRIQLDVNDVDLFDIPTGTPGDTSYYIIGYHLVTDTDSNQFCETFVQKMDDGSETIPENIFRGGADEVYISLYRVTQTGLNITSIDLILPSISNIGELKASLSIFKFRDNNGVAEFSIDGGTTWNKMGGNGMEHLGQKDVWLAPDSSKVITLPEGCNRVEALCTYVGHEYVTATISFKDAEGTDRTAVIPELAAPIVVRETTSTITLAVSDPYHGNPANIHLDFYQVTDLT